MKLKNFLPKHIFKSKLKLVLLIFAIIVTCFVSKVSYDYYLDCRNLEMDGSVDKKSTFLKGNKVVCKKINGHYYPDFTFKQNSFKDIFYRVRGEYGSMWIQYYVYDDYKIYSNSTYQDLYKKYGKDEENNFVQRKDIDPQTFRFYPNEVSGDFLGDKNSLFFKGEKLEGSDPGTFEKTDFGGKDKNQCYIFYPDVENKVIRLRVDKSCLKR